MTGVPSSGTSARVAYLTGRLERIGEVDLSSALSASPFADRIPGILREAHELLAEVPAQRMSETD